MLRIFLNSKALSRSTWRLERCEPFAKLSSFSLALLSFTLDCLSICHEMVSLSRNNNDNSNNSLGHTRRSACQLTRILLPDQHDSHSREFSFGQHSLGSSKSSEPNRNKRISSVVASQKPFIYIIPRAPGL